MRNYGIIPGEQTRPTDYAAGTVPHEVRIPNGNWKPYNPLGERQHSRYADSMGCVSFSDLNCTESQITLLTGKQRNYSDRWLAKMSETTPQGNYLWRVADELRLRGAVSEELWPAPPEFTWDTYYAEIPQDIQDKGIDFIKEFEVKYEWIDVNKDSFMFHLKHAPLQVVFPNHAVMAFMQEDDVTHYFDSYIPYEKTTTDITHAMKVVINLRDMKLTKEQLNKLYLLAFKRQVDEGGANYWANKELDEILDGLIASEENKKYTPVFESVKDVENWARNNG